VHFHNPAAVISPLRPSAPLLQKDGGCLFIYCFLKLSMGNNRY
jgi:hypothetical protein